ncbi:MAG: membrane protein insertase YidC [Planctomycetes bacterium]|nr:membrane protein insertase YidC [Planctomycetota bacterium]
MDQRKFITFMLLVVAAMMLFSSLFPVPEQPKQPAPAAGAKDDGKAAQVADNDVQPQPGEQPPAGEQQVDGQPQPGAQPPAIAKPGELQIGASAGETQFVTIGSLNRDDGYRMLVTLTSSGAAVRRAELSSPRFTDQHDWSGYLGELELKDVPDGVEVQVVGAGTPAALAHPAPIVVGDVIVAIGDAKPGEKLTSKSLQAALEKTQPRREITLQVRSGANAPQARTVRLARRPLSLLRPEIENYELRDVAPPADFVDRPSLLMTLPQLNGKPLSKANAKRLTKLLETGNWQLTAHDQKSATFSLTPVPNLTIIKHYTLAPVPTEKRDDPNYPGYHVQLDVEFQNTAEEPQSLVYQMEGPTGMPLEGWWYAHKISRHRWFKGAGLRDIVVRFDGNQVTQLDCPAIVAGDYGPMGQGEALAYAGVDGQYFASVMVPVRKALDDVWFETVEAIVVGSKPDARYATFANTSCRLTRLPIKVPAGGTHAESYQVFIGPKRPDLLAQYMAANDPNYSLSDIVYYGLALFAAVARAMLAILHFFYGIVGNYGIAIIMLTVLVRGAMFPLSYKQTKSMARMQALKPEMDRINEQYKTDMQKRSQAMQDLYRKHQINPLAGCLPVFLQLPIFMGLYRSLMVDVELRQSPLFGQSVPWCSDLAAPDMLWNWSSFMPPFIESFLGPYLNILPLITVALFLVTQKMSMPAPTNEQAAMQQKMMKYMTIFIGFMFYKVASGLCLYFIASSLWGIAERKLLPKTQTADSTAGGAPGSGGGRPGNGGPKSGPNGKPRSKKSRKVRPKK